MRRAKKSILYLQQFCPIVVSVFGEYDALTHYKFIIVLRFYSANTFNIFVVFACTHKSYSQDFYMNMDITYFKNNTYIKIFIQKKTLNRFGERY